MLSLGKRYLKRHFEIHIILCKQDVCYIREHSESILHSAIIIGSSGLAASLLRFQNEVGTILQVRVPQPRL